MLIAISEKECGHWVHDRIRIMEVSSSGLFNPCVTGKVRSGRRLHAAGDSGDTGKGSAPPQD
ncbi:MAG: hypothetical protein APR53_00055 [Methanoculleus sp. SDB]|nr:MAG: hypothetical protein APR53_00055 [Methanoculleus sp. SDB]